MSVFKDIYLNNDDPDWQIHILAAAVIFHKTHASSEGRRRLVIN